MLTRADLDQLAKALPEEWKARVAANRRWHWVWTRPGLFSGVHLFPDATDFENAAAIVAMRELLEERGYWRFQELTSDSGRRLVATRGLKAHVIEVEGDSICEVYARACIASAKVGE